MSFGWRVRICELSFKDCGYSVGDVEEKYPLPQSSGHYLICDKVRGEIYPGKMVKI